MKYRLYAATMSVPTEKYGTETKIYITPKTVASSVVTEKAANCYYMDKPKVYYMSSETGFSINTKGVVKITNKPKGNDAKINAVLKNDVLTIKTPKKLPASAKTYILVVYNSKSADGYFVLSVNLK